MTKLQHALHQKALAHERLTVDGIQRAREIMGLPRRPCDYTEEAIEAELEVLGAAHARMILANKAIRENDMASLRCLRFTEAQIDRLFLPDWQGKYGFPTPFLASNNLTIKMLKKRLEDIRSGNSIATPQGCRTVFVDRKPGQRGRIELHFETAPADRVRCALRNLGFRWNKFAMYWYVLDSDAGRKALDAFRVRLEDWNREQK